MDILEQLVSKKTNKVVNQERFFGTHNVSIMTVLAFLSLHLVYQTLISKGIYL